MKTIKWRNVTGNGLSIIRIQTHVTFLARFPNKICKRSPPPTPALRLHEERRTNNAQWSSLCLFFSWRLRRLVREGKVYALRYERAISWLHGFYWVCRRCVRAFTPKRTLFREALKSVNVGRVRAAECYSDAFGKKIKENSIFRQPASVLFAFSHKSLFRSKAMSVVYFFSLVNVELESLFVVDL